MTIEVLNGTERPDLAQAVAEYPSGRGYQVVSLSNADRQDYTDSTIMVPAGKAKMGRELASALNLAPASFKEGVGPGRGGRAAGPGALLQARRVDNLQAPTHVRPGRSQVPLSPSGRRILR